MLNQWRMLRTPIWLFLPFLVLSVQTAPTIQAQTTSVFINELHYDNDGGDTGEFVEVAGPAGTDLTGWSIVLYNGSGGAAYATINLGGTIPDQGNGFGTLAFPRAGIQNGAPDGLALVNNSAAVVQFLSYEVSFVATNGPANGLTSTDIGVSEPGNDPAGSSLQLTGTGLIYEAFAWTGPADDSPGDCNAGQTFREDTSNPTLNLVAVTDTVIEGGDLVYEVQLDQTVDFDVSVDYTVAGSGAAPAEAEDFQGGTFPGGSATILANDTSQTIVLTTVDNNEVESDETVEIAISINGATSGAVALGSSTGAGTISDNDTSVQPAKIHQVQGDGLEVTNPGLTTVITGVVTVDYQDSNELRGFFMQEESADEDGDPATSEGIFVFCGGCPVAVAEGNIVQVTGTQEEFFGMSQVDMTDSGGNITVIDASNNLGLIAPAQIDLPVPTATNAAATFEPYEGMLVLFVDQLTVTEYFQLGRFGQILLAAGGKQRQFTLDNPPGVAGYAAHLNEIARHRIILDDLTNFQNIDPVYHPQPGGFSKDNFIRGGYTVSNLTGVLHWSFAGFSGTNAWRVRPQKTNPVTFDPDNPSTTAPTSVGGSLKVVSSNVLNYFTSLDTGAPNCGPTGGLDCRGAHSSAELARQTAKIVAALKAIDADIVGLIELENNASASLQALVDALNAEPGAGPYAFVNTGTIGTDAIKVGFIYKSSTVTPVGPFKILDSSVDPSFIDTKNRPVLIQTFAEIATNERLTIALNHLKSKGSACNDVGDQDTGDGQGNCNLTRTSATLALANYLATDPTGSGDPDFLIIGDLNAYPKEDPITTLKVAGYTNLPNLFSGAAAYSYVFDGQWGYLDYALANASLTPQVTGVTEWHINSDEVDLLDYNDTVRDGAEAAFEVKPATNLLYNPDPYRASDHDPIIVGLALHTLAAIPQCNGVNATVYVGEDGTIVGGLADGYVYRGILAGTLGDDVIVGTDDADRISGFAGDDLICGLDGNDILNGLRGNDTLDGGDGDDVLNAGAGNDRLSGGEDQDRLHGGLGTDTCDGGNGSDVGVSCETKVNIP